MELQKAFSCPIKLDTEENREALQAIMRAFIILCKAIQEKNNEHNIRSDLQTRKGDPAR